jgi:hypothetical protein
MNTSLQRIADDPPTYALRVHPHGGSWWERSDYDTAATIQVYGAVATMQALVMRDGGKQGRERITSTLRELKLLGVRALIGTRGASDRLDVWTIP